MKISNILDITWQLKKIICRAEIEEFTKILKENSIEKDADILKDPSDLKKSVFLKLHPDKGGSEEGFTFVKNLEEKINKEISIEEFLLENLYQSILSFKSLDVLVDAVRVLHEPSAAHATKLIVDTAHLYKSYNGFNESSLLLSLLNVSYLAYNEEYLLAFKQLASTAIYMSATSVIGLLGAPYIGISYGVAAAAYTGYSALTNLYSLYNEYNNEDSAMKSAMAYKNVLDILGKTSLAKLYDFESSKKSYQIEINNLSLIKEKQFYKNKLNEDKGELGEKLYAYIYKPLLEEKYELQNKFLQGNITEEEANKLKQTNLTIEGKNYNHCVEVKNSGLNETQKEGYYCYDEKQAVLDHMAFSGNMLGVLESL